MRMRITTSLRTVMPRTVSVNTPLAFSSVMTAMVVAGDFATATSPKISATAKATRGGSGLRKSMDPLARNTVRETRENIRKIWKPVITPMLRRCFLTDLSLSSPPAERAIRAKATPFT